MSKMIEKIALEEAVNTVFTSTGELSVARLMNKLEKGDIPEETSLWIPFEHYDARSLLEVIEQFQAQFERFAKEVVK